MGLLLIAEQPNYSFKGNSLRTDACPLNSGVRPMKYDDASWHSGGDFPAELPSEAGATHIGMFLAWATLSGLGSGLYVGESPELLAQLRDRSITPGSYVLAVCDGKFTDEDLSDEGNSFAGRYYDSEEAEYLDDYGDVLGPGTPDGPHGLYYIADTWANFDRLKPKLDERLTDWRSRSA